MSGCKGRIVHCAEDVEVCPAGTLDALRELVADPVVAGMGAAIRDHAKHRGRQCPLQTARALLDNWKE